MPLGYRGKWEINLDRILIASRGNEAAPWRKIISLNLNRGYWFLLPRATNLWNNIPQSIPLDLNFFFFFDFSLFQNCHCFSTVRSSVAILILWYMYPLNCLCTVNNFIFYFDLENSINSKINEMLQVTCKSKGNNI